MDPIDPSNTGRPPGPVTPGGSDRPEDKSGSRAVHAGKQVLGGPSVGGTELQNRDIKKHTGHVPSITRPSQAYRGKTATRIADTHALRQLRSHFDIHDDLVEEISERTKDERQDRLEQVYRAFEKHVARSGSENEASGFFSRLPLNKEGKPILSREMVFQLLDRISAGTDGANRRLEQRGRISEAWYDFFTERRSLEKLTRELAENAARFCEESLEGEPPLVDIGLDSLSQQVYKSPMERQTPPTIPPPMLPTVPTELSEPLISFTTSEEEKLRKERDQLNEKMLELKQQLKAAEAHKPIMADREVLAALEKLQSRFDGVESRLQGLEKKPKQKQKQSINFGTSPVVAPAVERSTESSAKSGVESLERELFWFQKEHEKLGTQLQEKSELVGSLKKDVQYEREQNQERAIKLNQKKKQLKHLEREKEQLQEKLFEIQSRPGEIVDPSDDRTSQLRVELGEKQKELDIEREETRRSQADVISRQQAIIEKEQKITHLSEQLSKFKTESIELREQLANAKEQLSHNREEAHASLKLLKQTYDGLRAEFVSTKTIAKEVESNLYKKITELERSYEGLSQQAQEKSVEITQLAAQLEGEKQLNSERELRLGDQKEQYQVLSGERDKLLEQAESLRAELTSAKVDEESIRRLEAQVADRDNALSQIQKNRQWLQSQFELQKLEIEGRGRAIEGLQSQAAALKVQRQWLSEKLESANKTIEGGGQKLSEAVTRVRELQESYEEITAKQTHLTETVDILSKEKATLATENDELKERGKTLNTELEAAKQKVHEIERIQQQLTEELVSVKSTYEQTTYQLAQVLKFNEKRVGELQVIQDRTKEVEVERENIKKELSRVTVDLHLEEETSTDLRTKVENLQNELGEKDKEIDRLKGLQVQELAAISSKQSEHSHLLERIESLLTQKENLTEEKTELTRQVSQLKEEVQIKINELEEEKTTLSQKQSSIDELESEKTSLNTQISEKDGQIKVAEAALIETEALKASLAKQVNELTEQKQSDVDAFESERLAAADKQKDSDRQIRELASQVETDKVDLKEKSEKVNELEKTLEKTAQELKELKKAHEELKESEQEFKKRAEEERDVKKQTESEIVNLKEQFKQLEEKNEELGRSVKAKKTEVEDKQKALTLAEKKASQLESDFEKVEGQREIAQTECDQLKQQLVLIESKSVESEVLVKSTEEYQKKKLSEAQVVFDAQIKHLKSELSVKEAKLTELTKSVEQSEKKYTREEEKVKELNKKVEAAQKSYETLESQHKESVVKQESLEDELNDSKKLLEEEKTAKSLIQTEVETLKSKNEKLTNEVVTLNEKVQEADRNVREKLSELNTAKEATTQLIAQVSKLERLQEETKKEQGNLKQQLQDITIKMEGAEALTKTSAQEQQIEATKEKKIYEEKLEKLKKEISAKDTELSGLQHRIDESEKKVAQTEKTVQRLTEEAETAGNSYQDLKSKYEDSLSEKEKINEELLESSKLVTSLNAQLEELGNRVFSLTESENTAKEEVVRRQEKIDEVSEKLKKLEETKSELKQDLEKMKDTFKEYMKFSDEKMKLASVAATKFREVFEAKARELREVSGKLDGTERELNTVAESAKKSEEELERVKQELNQQKQSLATETEKVAEHLTEMDELRGLNDKLKKEKELAIEARGTAEKTIETLQDGKEKLNSELLESQEKVIKLQGAIETHKTNYSDLNAKYQLLQKEKGSETSQLASRLQEEKTKIENLKEKLASELSKCETLERDKTTLDGNLQDEKDEVKRQKEIVSERQILIEKQGQQILDLKSKLKELESDLKKSITQHEEGKTAQVEVVKQLKSQHQAKVLELASETERVRGEQVQLQSKVEKLEETEKETEKEKEKIESNLENLKHELTTQKQSAQQTEKKLIREKDQSGSKVEELTVVLNTKVQEIKQLEQRVTEQSERLGRFETHKLVQAASVDDEGVSVGSSLSLSRSDSQTSEFSDIQTFDEALLDKDLKSKAARRLVDDLGKTTVTAERIKVQAEVCRGFDKLQTRAKELAEVETVYTVDVSPSEQSHRESVLELYRPFSERVAGLAKTLAQTIGNDQDRDSFYHQVNAIAKVSTSATTALEEKIDDFDAFSKQVESLKEGLESGWKNSPPDEMVDQALQQLMQFRKGADVAHNPEYYGYSAGVLLKRTADQLCKDFEEKVKVVELQDDRHQLLRSYKYELQRLGYESLPDALKRGLPIDTQNYLKLVWGDSDRQLDKAMVSIDTMGPSSALPDVREALLVHDPVIARRIVAMIDRLDKEDKKQKDEAVDANPGFSYSNSSLLARQSLRRDYQLAKVPMMKRLLEAAEADLKLDNSTLLTASVEAHHENYQTQSTERRQKLLARTQRLLKLEKALGPCKPEAGVPVGIDGSEVEHAHEKMLACFNSSDGYLDRSGPVRDEESSFARNLVDQKDKGLFNVFFSDLPAGGNALLEESKATGEMTLSLSSRTRCEPPLVFQSKDGKRWNTLLNGVTWTVDPSLIHDNPNLKVPFGDNEGSRWDWLPLRNSSGETSVLMLEKKTSPLQCRMYEVGSNDSLVPVLLQGAGNQDEYVDAMVLAQAHQLNDNSPECKDEEVSNATKQLKRLNRPWLSTRLISSGKRLRQLEQLRRDIELKATEVLRQELFQTEAMDTESFIVLPPTAEIDRKKAAKTGSGMQLESCKPESLEHFAVSADFNALTSQYVAKRKDAMSDPAAMEFMEREVEEFAKKAFPGMVVFAGCEMRTLTGRTTWQEIKANRRQVRLALNKTIKNSNKHCDHARDLKASLEHELVGSIRLVQGGDNTKGELAGYSDRDLLDYAIKQFERGEIPAGLKNSEQFAQKMAELMLVEIDLQQREQVNEQLEAVQGEFEHICNNAVFLEQNPEEYSRRCRDWTLKVAMIAGRHQQVLARIQSYKQEPMSSAVRARMSFERRRKIIFTVDQADEVKRALSAVKNWSEGEKVTLVSHKGTGFGKSTLLLAISDYAAASVGTQTDRSPIVMAPPSNQAELDDMFGSYFGSKGLTYRRLDLKSLSDRSPGLLTETHLNMIENTLLGLPEDTLRYERNSLLKRGRAPVGASITDIQALMYIKKELSNKECTLPNREALLERMDQILDLLRNSMIFADEWDSNMVPHTSEQLSVVVSGVNQVLENLQLKTIVKPEDINVSHSEFLLGANRHGFSATLGTDYASAMLTESESIEGVKEQAHTDVLTTTERFMHQMSQAELMVVDSADDHDQEKTLKQLVQRTGGDVPMVIFNGQDDGSDRTKAEQQSLVINEQRRAMGKPTKGVLYYKDDKKLCMQRDGDPVYGQGAVLKGDLEKQLRMTGAYDADSYLAKPESVGTDAPQGMASVGVVMGLLKQTGSAARMDLMNQQVGRLTRGSKSLYKQQKLIVVVDKQELDQLEDSHEKQVFLKAQEALEKTRAEVGSKLGVSSLDDTGGDIHTQLFLPMKVPLPRPTRNQSMEDAVSKAFETELARIQQEEWSTLKLSPDLKAAMIQFKRAQWEAQQAWMKLLGTEMASRQVTEETMGYESRIEQAGVNAYLNKAYSEQHQWLQDNAVKHVDEQVLTSEMIEEKSLQQVVPILKSSLVNRIKDVSRRQHQGDVPVKSVTHAASMEELKQEFETHFSELEQNGVDLGNGDFISEAKAELIKQSVSVFEDCKGKVAEVHKLLGGKYSKYSGGQKELKVLLERIDSDIERVRQGNIDFAMDTAPQVQKRYDEMMEAITHIVINTRAPHDEIRKAPARIMKIIRGCVFVDESKYKLVISQINKATAEKLGLEIPIGSLGTSLQKIRWAEKTKGAPEFKQIRATTDKAEGHYVHTSFALGQQSHNARTLGSAVDGMKQAQEKKRLRGVAIDVCSTPNNQDRAELVKQMRRDFMEHFDQFGMNQEKQAQATQAVMETQGKLKQVNQQRSV
ncbi:hypothetical protein EOPP23_12455 [Endozoicomonas sp. OPT23]|uniref:hypothetical protein n=1 Tax=Endozoicomonas sp. OPT23 TaxID=2072845 RepID=UPI00129B73CD|nr:hypothetical protein [Endozoicomonas sp. OPT23]MRI33797.1 hypothetical protein [Endozoicomonas sp. OPT23]